MAGTESDLFLLQPKPVHELDGTSLTEDKNKLGSDNLVGTKISEIRVQSEHPELPSSKRLLSQLEEARPVAEVSQRTISSDASVEEARLYFAQGNGKPADLAKLCAGTQICSIGETHNSLSAKEFLAKQVPALAQAGYTQFGFEMIKSENQKQLDDYLAGKISKDILLTKENFGRYEFQPGAPEKYVEILDAIKEYNFEHGKQLRAFALDAPNHSDEFWAGEVHKAMQDNPDARIVTYTGVGHLPEGVTSPWCDFSCELDKFGHPSRTVVDIDSVDPKTLNPNIEWFDDIQHEEQRFAAGAVRAGIDDFTAAALTKTNDRRADYAVFAPWTELPTPILGTTIQEKDGERIAEIPVPTRDGVESRLQVTFSPDATVKQLQFTQGASKYTIIGKPADREIILDDGEGQVTHEKPPEEATDGWRWLNDGLPGQTFYTMRSEIGELQLIVELDPNKRIKTVRANPTLLYPPYPQ